MEPLVTILLMAAVVVGAVAVARVVHRARERAWRRAAAALALTDVSVAKVLGWSKRLTARAGSLSVTLEGYSRSKEDHGTRVVISGMGLGTGELDVRREGIGTRVEKLFGETELGCGDAAFDERAYIRGTPPMVHALLTAETRRRLSTLLEPHIPLHAAPEGPARSTRARLQIQDDKLRLELRGAVPKHLETILRLLLDCAEQLRRPADIPARLSENARVDPVSAVRLANLETLLAGYAGHPATQAALQGGVGDADPRLRLRAATALGDEGGATLLDLASDGGVPEALAVQALDVLGDRMPIARALGLLDASVETGRLRVARRVVAMLGRARATEATGRLVAILGHEDDSLAATAATALGDIGGQDAEGDLVRMLAAEASDRQRVAALTLGRVGTVAAVAPLHEVVERQAPLSVRQAAKEAIAAIQSRLTGAHAGQMALADSGGGDLWLPADDVAGRLALDALSRMPEAAHADAPQAPATQRLDGSAVSRPSKLDEG